MTMTDTLTLRYLEGAHLLAASRPTTGLLTSGLYPDPGATAPSSEPSSAFSTIVGDMKWVAGAAAIVGIFIVVIMGVVAHRRGESMIDAFGGFVKIIALLTGVSSAVSVVSAFIS
jgi:hypothetical protein